MATIPIYFDKDKYEKENGKSITICFKNFEEPAVLSRYKDPTIEELQDRIDKTVKILEMSALNKGICTNNETDTIQKVLSILRGEDNESN